MKLETIFENILLKEYSEKVYKTLEQKFPNVTDIRAIIDRFQQVKDSPKVIEKDILKYDNINDIKKAIEQVQSKRIKAGKINKEEVDGNLIFNKNGIRVYVANDKKSCVKYGNGYSFCISSRGETNSDNDDLSHYGNYRYSNNATPYFIFNDNITNVKKYSSSHEKEIYLDPEHLLVILAYKNGTLSITNAENDGEAFYDDVEDMRFAYSWIFDYGIDKLLVYRDFDKDEKKFYLPFIKKLKQIDVLKSDYLNDIIYDSVSPVFDEANNSVVVVDRLQKLSINEYDILKNKINGGARIYMFLIPSYSEFNELKDRMEKYFDGNHILYLMLNIKGEIVAAKNTSEIYEFIKNEMSESFSKSVLDDKKLYNDIFKFYHLLYNVTDITKIINNIYNNKKFIAVSKKIKSLEDEIKSMKRPF